MLFTRLQSLLAGNCVLLYDQPALRPLEDVKCGVVNLAKTQCSLTRPCVQEGIGRKRIRPWYDCWLPLWSAVRVLTLSTSQHAVSSPIQVGGVQLPGCVSRRVKLLKDLEKVRRRPLSQTWVRMQQYDALRLNVSSSSSLLPRALQRLPRRATRVVVR